MSSMTKQEAIEILTEMRDWNDYITQSDALQMAIDALEKKPCTDAISRQAIMDGLEKYHDGADMHIDGLTYAYDLVCKLPSVSTEKTGHCKDCKYFEYDSVAKVDGIPLIVAHEICSRWGEGCKTKEDGYCFLFEPQESEG